jgi:ferredoxin--NADP+ reductase
MAKILRKAELAPAVFEFVVAAPLVTHRCQPGQFVIIRVDETVNGFP